MDKPDTTAITRDLRQMRDEISRFAEVGWLLKDRIEETCTHLRDCANALDHGHPLLEWQAKRRIEQALSALDEAMFMADEFTAARLGRVRARLVSTANKMRTAAA